MPGVTVSTVRLQPAPASCDDDALLRAELRDAQAQARVAVGVDGRQAPGAAADARRPAEARHAGIDAAGVGGIEPHEREVVVRAGVGVGLTGRLHRQPGVVDERAGAAGAGHGDRRAERQRRARAAVRRERPAGARAVRGLADVGARGVAEDEVRRALRAAGQRLHARVDRGGGRGGSSRREDADDGDQSGTSDPVPHGALPPCVEWCTSRVPPRRPRAVAAVHVLDEHRTAPFKRSPSVRAVQPADAHGDRPRRARGRIARHRRAAGVRAHAGRRRRSGIVLAFGAGALISAVSVELVEEGVQLGGLGWTAAGLAAGALTYYLLDGAIERRFAGAGAALALGAFLDGIPEQLVLGIAIGSGEPLGLGPDRRDLHLQPARGDRLGIRAARRRHEPAQRARAVGGGRRRLHAGDGRSAGRSRRGRPASCARRSTASPRARCS